MRVRIRGRGPGQKGWGEARRLRTRVKGPEKGQECQARVSGPGPRQEGRDHGRRVSTMRG
jgi:hypothetical protein